MLYRFDDKRCLNGMWKIKPVYEGGEGLPPEEGFEERQYLVPSFFNRSRESVRLPGEKYFGGLPRNDERLLSEDVYLPYDNYGYPGIWTAAKGAWICREFDVRRAGGKRYFLVFEGIGPYAGIYVNGVRLAETRDSTLPHFIDITPALKTGENRLACYVADYDRALHRAKWPCGGVTESVRGIIGDVYLLERNEVYTEDAIIVTSVRNKTISFTVSAVNASSAPFTGKLKISLGPDAPALEKDISIPAGERAQIRLASAWDNPLLWDTDTPNLYMAEIALVNAYGEPVSVQHERFGFREVWIEGPDIMLNNHPVHLFADWGHRSNLIPFKREWVEKWLGMIRDYNMNHSRLHTAPHPEFILEMADEKGILITDETALFGSGDTQAAAYDEYWTYAAEHVKRFVKRDKNHPCLILWSCENEMRWLGEGYEKCKAKLPEIRALFNALDPTRPAYHEGDSSMWNEKEQAIISRHYGKDCTGLGWWDRTQPLHSGEIGLYHYSGPNNTVQFGGDGVWADQAAVNRCAVEETLRVVTDARANGVCALGPWNFSCLLNPRMHPEMSFSYDDWTLPGQKPLFVHENTAEFMFWQEGKGYIPSPDADKIRFMFRPFAAIDLSLRRSFFADRAIEKEITFVNDTCGDIENALCVLTLSHPGGEVRSEQPVSVGRGRTVKKPFRLEPSFAPGEGKLNLRVIHNGKEIENQSVTVTLDSYSGGSRELNVYVIGDGSSEPALRAAGIGFTRADSIDEVPAGETVILERGCILPGTAQNEAIARLCARGGRVILLEQRFSAFPSIAMAEKPLQSAFGRDPGNPVLKGLPDSALRFWGDSPYSLLSGDSYVAQSVYKKDSLGRMRVIVDSGEGNFGDGDLENALVFSSVEGEGIVYACQMPVTEKYATVAAAGRLLVNLVAAAVGYRPAEANNIVMADNADSYPAALETARSGGCAVALCKTPEDAGRLAELSGLKLNAVTEEEGTYNCVKAGVFPELAGLSNADITGIERVSYCPGEAQNRKITSVVLDDCPSLTPLLVTAPESCQRPFFVYGCSSEITRASTMTRYCVNREENPYTVLGLANFGKGRLYISTYVNPAPENSRLSRLYNVLKTNLTGIPAGESLLSGGLTRNDMLKGSGTPEKLYVFTGIQTELERVLKACAYNVERMNPRPLLTMYESEQATLEGGAFTLPAGETLLYFTLTSQKKRARPEVCDWLPDPLAETFLDISLTDGEAAVYVNGNLCSEAKKGATSLADICIERGFNHVLLALSSPAETRLTLKWRNILGETEGGFRFN